MNKVYGIDLGTTYSCIAVVGDHGKPEVIANNEGELTTPSVVYFESESSIVVGKTAKESAKIYSSQVASTPKRFMGNQNYTFRAFDQNYTAQEISSHILRKLVEDAQKTTGEEIKDVVITCPAYFGVNQKEATKQAGEIAGLNVLYVIPEPTAAAIAYGIDRGEDQTVLVYDLGGGTFDITLIEIKGGDVRVIATGGNDKLGGKDWDDAIVNYLANSFADETGNSAEAMLDDPDTYQELLNRAEEIKKALSTKNEHIELVRFEADKAKIKITREKFDELTSNLLERTISFTEEIIDRVKKKGYNKIDIILLVGGSTYMPQVQKRLNDLSIKMLQIDPNQIVAKGAAIFGQICITKREVIKEIAVRMGITPEEVNMDTVTEEVMEKAKEEVQYAFRLSGAIVDKSVKTKIQNVTSKSFGVIAVDQNDNEIVSQIIIKDDAVPCHKEEMFGTSADDQIQVDVKVMESEISDRVTEVSHCNELGNFAVTFAHPLPKHSPISITFILSEDGLLSAKAHDKTTGAEADIKLETDSIMSKEQVEEAKSRNLAMMVS